MSDFESNVGLNIDVSQALTAIKTLQRQISDFHSSLAKGSATANLKSLQMQQSLIDTVNATGQYSAQMKTVASATQTFTTALEKNKLSMGQYFKYAGGASKSFGRFFKNEMDTVQKVAIERVKDLQTQYIKMGRDANGAIRSIAIRPLALDMDNLATKTQIAAQKQQLLNQLLKQGSTNLLNFGKNTQWAGRQLMVGFTIPLGIFGATAAKTFMQMEEQAIKFKRVYGDTFTATKETDAMLKQVQQLATEFTKYGVAVEKTMEQAAKAAATGKMGADLLAQVSEATRLSVLGNVEQAQALETTISLTNAFGTSADQLRGKINFLNAVENQTVTSIEDLTIAIPKAAPVIQQLGGDVEDLTFFLTAMREGGINASESANALKSGLASLINPTKKASDFLQGFGININKIVEGNKGNVQGLVVDFAKALDTLDPLNRARAIEQLFGKFQFSRLSTLFQNVIKDGSQAAKVLELTRQSSAELGILAQRELNKISASPMYKFQKAIADFKKELAPVGEEFLKAVTPIIQFGTDILKAFNNLDGGVKQFIVNATGLVAGLGPIFLMTFGLIANGVANIIKGFTFVKTVFNKASSASTILGETTDYMTQQQIEAAAAAASLEQVHNKLTQAFTVETTAVGKLAAAYQKAVSAQNAFTGPPATGKPRRAKKYADGVFSVPGPKGAGDIVPAMLSPGEAVIPAKMASKYSGFINGMISGSIPGFKNGKPLSERLKVKGSSDAPGFISAQSKNFNWTSRDAEIQSVIDLAKQYGFEIDDVFKNNYLTTHASHLEPSFKQVNLGRGLIDKIKQWFAGNLMADLGIVNKPLQDISDPNIRKLGKGSSKRKILEEFERSIPQIAKELGMSEKEVKRLGMQTLTGKHPKNNKSAAVASRIFGIAEGQATTPEAKTRLGGARKVLDIRTDPKNDFYATSNKRKYVDDEKKRNEHEKKILDKKKQVVKEATAAEVKALAARRQVAEAQTKGAKQAKRTAVAQTGAEKQKTRTAQTAKKLSKAEENRLKREAANKARSTSQTKVSATPKIRTTEELGDGLKRVVTTDSNGKQEERYYLQGRKGSVSAKEAQAMLAARRGGTTPGGKLKGFFSGTMGKLGMASMLASMGASAIPGVSGTGIDSTLSTLSYGLMGAEAAKGLFGGRQKFDAEGNPLPSRLDNIKKSETYKNISSKISGSKMAGRFGAATGAAKTFKLDAAASVASKGLMKSMPMLAKGASMLALRFLNVIPIVGQIALGLEIAYNVLTINARKQEEISKAVIDTLTMTKDKLAGLNDFFGTEATLSGIRTATPGIDATPQGSLVKQFMESEQFKNTYKETAGKLRGASNEQFGITMQSLALDLYGQGMGEEQVQIIIDAIKTEAGKTDLVINFKDLKLDTEAGMTNLGNSISKITDGAIREFKSNRDWLGINWEAQAKLDEFEAQMSGFISAISQEFEKGRISVQEFEAAFRNIQLSAVKLEEANAGDGIAHLKDVMERTNPQLAQAAMLISDVTTYLNMMKAAAMGVNLSENLLTDLGAPEGSDARKNAEGYLKRASDYEKEKSKKIDKLNKKLAGTNKQSQNLEKQEQGINDLFDKRIKALERINQLQEQISKQKQNELDLADALSRGDVFAAAQAQQKIRADQASLALEQQKAALQDEKDKQLGNVQDKQDAVAGGAQKIQDEIAKANNAKFSEVYKTDTKSLRQMYESIKQPFGFMTMPASLFMSEEDKFKMFTDMMSPLVDMKRSLGFQSGGYISGPGSGTSDSIPARLSNGEYVIRAKAVQALGTDVLDKMNHAEKFAKGGIVNKPKTGSTASIYSDDKSVDMSDGNVIGHGLNFVMNSIYESLFGKWFVQTKHGNPTLPDAEDMGTMALNVAPIPGIKALKLAGAGAKGLAKTKTVTGAMAAIESKKSSLAAAAVAKLDKKAALQAAKAFDPTKPATSKEFEKAIMLQNFAFSSRGSSKKSDSALEAMFSSAAYHASKEKFGVINSSYTDWTSNPLSIASDAAAKVSSNLAKLDAVEAGVRGYKDGDIYSFINAIKENPNFSKWESLGIDGNYLQNLIPSGLGGSGFDSAKFLEEILAEKQQLANLSFGAQEFLANPTLLQTIKRLTQDKKSKKALEILHQMRTGFYSTSPGLKGFIEKLPPSIRALFYNITSRHRSSEAITDVLHPSNVPMAHGRVYGPGVYAALTPETSAQHFSGFGDVLHKMTMSPKGILKTLFGKGYIDTQGLAQAYVKTMGTQSDIAMQASVSGNQWRQFANTDLNNMSWDHPLIQTLIKQGYQGYKHGDAIANWLVGVPGSGFGLKSMKNLDLTHSLEKLLDSGKEGIQGEEALKAAFKKLSKLSVQGTGMRPIIETISGFLRKMTGGKSKSPFRSLFDEMPEAANGGLVKFAKGGLVKRDATSSDSGINWLNQFVQNLLGGGNPTSFMQNDQTKDTFVSAYNQGAKNTGIDFTDPMFYTSLMPLGGLGAIGKISKGFKGVVGGLKSAKAKKIANQQLAQIKRKKEEEEFMHMAEAWAGPPPPLFPMGSGTLMPKSAKSKGIEKYLGTVAPGSIWDKITPGQDKYLTSLFMNDPERVQPYMNKIAAKFGITPFTGPGRGIPNLLPSTVRSVGGKPQDLIYNPNDSEFLNDLVNVILPTAKGQSPQEVARLSQIKKLVKPYKKDLSKMPGGIRAALEDMFAIHRSFKPNLKVTSQSKVRSQSNMFGGPLEGPGTYTSGTLKISDQFWSDYAGDNLYRQSYSDDAFKQILSSKGYASEDIIGQTILSNPSLKKKYGNIVKDFGNGEYEVDLQNLDISNPIFKKLMKDGYIGYRGGPDRKTNWMIGQKGFGLEKFEPNMNSLLGYAKGGLVKRDVASYDPGINWLNDFIQNLLGGGNPSAAMQNNSTRSLFANSYTQGAKNMGVDPTDPMFYASMFAPSMGIKALGMAGKGVSKLKGLSASKNTGPRVTLPNYIDNPRISQAYLNFMRTNPAISVRMRSEQLIDKLAKKDFAYRNAFEEGMVVDDLDPRLEVENMLFGLGKDAPASSRPIYGAGVSPYTPWSIRGKASRNDNAFERWALRSKSSNINSEYFDRYGDISLLLKNRVKKRSTFTLGDSFVARKTDSLVPGGTKKTVAAPFGTMSQSKILGASTAMNRPDLQFVEAQIFGGLPFSDIKKIIVKNPEMIPLLQQKLAEAGLKIPVGQTKLSPLGKLNEMFYKNKVHGPTGLPMFIPKFKSGGMFRTPYADGGLAMLHDKEFVMNPGAVKEYGVDKLKAMNNGTYNSGSVYNSYGVNINVGNSNASANDIARTVVKEIKRIDSQNIRSTKV
jgi:TP901 family phage tail tape measure protein